MYACVYIYSQKTVIHIHTPKEKKRKQKSCSLLTVSI